MEELHRTHKDVPFGWVALLQDFLTRRAARPHAHRSRRSWDHRLPTLPSDLHHLAGPH